MTQYAVFERATGRVRFAVKQDVRPDLTGEPTLDYIQAPDSFALNGQTWAVSGYALIPFTDPLDVQRNAKLAAARAYYELLITPPLGFAYSGNLYEVDLPSQQNLAAMGTLALGNLTGNGPVWPGGFYWVTLDGQQVSMTAAQMYAFAAAAALWVSASILNLDSIQASIRACTTLVALNAIDITAGYPSGSGALISAVYALPFEALGVSPVSAIFALPLETRESAGAEFALPLETRQAVTVTYPLPFESRLDNVGVILPLPLETQ